MAHFRQLNEVYMSSHFFLLDLIETTHCSVHSNCHALICCKHAFLVVALGDIVRLIKASSRFLKLCGCTPLIKVFGKAYLGEL